MKPIFILFVLLLSISAATAQTPPEKTDSTLLSYYQWCNAHRHERNVMLKADTLFQLAGQKNDVRMQCVALTIKADYYYFNNQLDSFKLWIPRVQEFAREHDQPKYYYFIWTRLVLYYTKQGQYTLAQYELERYLEQSRIDNFKPATANAYVQLAHIFSTRALHSQAADYYRQAIDYVEQNDLDKFQLPDYYGALAGALIELGDYTQAAEVIEKGKASLSLPEQSRQIDIQLAKLYLHTNKLAQARRIFAELKRNEPDDMTRIDLFLFEIKLFLASGEYENALTATDRLIDNHKRQGYPERYYLHLFNTKAELLAHLGRYQSAYDQLEYYTTVLHQKIADENQSSLSEFATLLDVARLNSDKIALQQQAQTERLHRTYVIISALATILALAGAFITLQTRTNRRLARAKRAAEESDRMKGIFIRNITHEINTPLNAIVGFAELAAAAPADSPDRYTYIDIIRENSGHLQKLVNDVLYISDIESSDLPPAGDTIDVNNCCIQSINFVGLNCPNPPRIIFERGCEVLTIHSTHTLIVKVLNELLINAARFAPGSPVTLAYNVVGATVQFVVTDAGPGIPAAEAERIFERFVKLDPFSQGLGLGLGVCRLIAQTLGGSISLDVNYTHGARFVFSVPGVEQPQSQA